MRKWIPRLLAGTLIGPALPLGAGAAWGSLTTPITDNSTADSSPAISSSNVVWYARDGSVDNDYDIYLVRGAPPLATPVPSISFAGLALLAGFVLGIVARARRGL